MLGMLGSAHDGERAAAGLKIHQLITAEHVTWEELLAPKPGQALATVAQGPRLWVHTVEDILEKHYSALRVTQKYNEIEFLTDVLGRALAPSPKQQKWIVDIANRCGVPLWEGCAP
jgi:hypothetical protein